MPSRRNFTSLKDFVRQLERDTKTRATRLDSAIRKTSRQVRNYVARETVPVAFGDVRDKLQVVDGPKGESRVIDFSPHAAALETGSRAHMPPVGPIADWVRLRGMQGISGKDRVAKRSQSGRYVGGTIQDWRKASSKWVAKQLAGKVRSGASPVDAPMQLAWAIAGAIAKRGTKAQPFMLKAVPYAKSELDKFVREALPDKD